MDGLDFVQAQLSAERGTERPPGAHAPGGRSGATAALAFVALLGCADARPFPGSAESLDALGREALDAFAREDRDALERFRLSESEHNLSIWPELPAAQGPSPYPIDLAWRNIEMRNARAVLRTASALEPLRPFEFLSVRCEGETQVFQSYRVHTDCHVHFLARGRERRIQLFKDVAERNGGYKIFRYYDEDPEVVVRDQPDPRALSARDSAAIP